MIIFKINILLIFLTKLIVYLYFFTLMLALSVFFFFFCNSSNHGLEKKCGEENS